MTLKLTGIAACTPTLNPHFALSSAVGEELLQILYAWGGALFPFESGQDLG